MSYKYAGSSSVGARYNYDVVPSPTQVDPYILENGVLRNKLGITDYDELRKVERELLKEKILSAEFVQSRKIDISLLKAIHKYIFGDLFVWAGEFRTITLSKAEEFFIPGLSIEYAYPAEIEKKLRKEISSLNAVRWSKLSVDEIAAELAIRFARIWQIHPFRDGNTRAILGFLKAFSLEHEFTMDTSVFINLLSRPLKDGIVIGYSIRDMFVAACLDVKPEPEHLIYVFKKAMHII